MNNILIIRKNKFKNYFVSGIQIGAIFGIIMFIALISKQTFLTSLILGISTFLLITIAFSGLGFLSVEYFDRKKEIKRLQSEKYSFLYENNFTIHEDLFYEGYYNNYYILVIPIKKLQKKRIYIYYDLIYAFYDIDDRIDIRELEKKISGNYFIGYLNFNNCCLECIPKDWEQPDFKENLDGLVSILKREDLKPISHEDWELKYREKFDEEFDKEEKSKTKQILKLGKSDIKYIKEKNNKK